MMDRHQEAYKEEARELLSELEDSLLELEETPDDPDLIGSVFRALHTIKGSGAMFGFDEIAAFTHEVETVFDLVRNGRIPVTKELIDLTLSARDQIRGMLDASDEEAPAGEETGGIVAALRALLPGPPLVEEEHSEQKSSLSGNPETEASASGAILTYRICFRPSPDILRTGTNPLLLFNELRELGECLIVAHTDRIPVLEEFDPEICYTSWVVILTTDRGENAIRDVFIFVEEDSDLSITVIDDSGVTMDEKSCKRLGEILVERGDVQAEDLEKVLAEQKRIGEMLVDAGLVEKERVESALAEQRQVRKVREKRQKGSSVSSIRVSSEKLDRLVDLVGELVTVQARLSQTVFARKDQDLQFIAEEVERLTGELRDNTMNIRMVPIGTTFSKFKRLVRDLSHELGKEIELTTEGAETELDKTVIERLNDPMVHLIRNCIDHGIETPEIREASGKPRRGTVRLAAFHSGSNVLIKISDDGAGIDPAALRAKGMEKGFITPDADLSEQELFQLLFVPGFSTSEKVTNVSGRGVGMDVVKKNIDALRGSIEIKSAKGTGTTIVLKLPLTLAIIEGLLVRIGEDFFVLPLSAVKECVELTREDVENAHGRNLAHVRGEIVPYIRLRERFRIDGEPPEIEQIVIAESDQRRVGFVVDGVVGEHQTVIKNLGRVYRHVEGVSGATILGDGTVALILDVLQLIQSEEEEAVCV